ncbi:MAG: hypothetical protein HZA91_10100 [Verrucomicrobia bacterium]|nr:hypothetical protein [Verrucomicrobiota bacterium]
MKRIIALVCSIFCSASLAFAELSAAGKDIGKFFIDMPDPTAVLIGFVVTHDVIMTPVLGSNMPRWNASNSAIGSIQPIYSTSSSRIYGNTYGRSRSRRQTCQAPAEWGINGIGVMFSNIIQGLSITWSRLGADNLSFHGSGQDDGGSHQVGNYAAESTHLYCSQKTPGLRKAIVGIFGRTQEDGLKRLGIICDGQQAEARKLAESVPAEVAESAPRPAVALADPELQKNAKPLVRNQSSVKGLCIITLSNGQRVGGAQDIIATAEPVSPQLETTCGFRADIAKDTAISMDEAVHLIKVQHPIWQSGYRIGFSYSNKYTKQSGGSAGGAFSVLLLSLLDGILIDPGFAMTGDVTVDGKIREVGAVSEKIRGAMLEKCTTVAIPVANKENLNDLVILYSPSMLWSMQLFSIATLDDAVAVARVNRAANLTKAMEMFAQLQRSMGANTPVVALRSPGVMQTMQQVLQLAPNHLSAEFMLRVGSGRVPLTLGLKASLNELVAAMGPLMGAFQNTLEEDQPNRPPGSSSLSNSYSMRNRFKLTVTVPTEILKLANDRLNWLLPKLDSRTRDLRAAMVDFITVFQQVQNQNSVSYFARQQYEAKREKVRGEMGKLGLDRKVLEEMMH